MRNKIRVWACLWLRSPAGPGLGLGLGDLHTSPTGRKRGVPRVGKREQERGGGKIAGKVKRARSGGCAFHRVGSGSEGAGGAMERAESNA